MTFFFHSRLGNDSCLTGDSAKLAGNHGGDVAGTDTFRDQRLRQREAISPMPPRVRDMAASSIWSPSDTASLARSRSRSRADNAPITFPPSSTTPR